MGTFPPFLPRLSLYDPAESSEGSIDPLGLAQLATNLADRLVPGFTERSRRPRFLVALAVGSRLLERAEYPGGTYGDHQDGPANIAFERLLLEAFAHCERPDERELVGTPGIGKAREARRSGIRLSSGRYLVAPGAVGLWVAYKRLAQELGILDENGHLLEGGYELLRAWEQGCRRPGILTGRDTSFAEKLDAALRPLLGERDGGRQPVQVWKELHAMLRPKGLTRSEGRVLRRLLFEGNPDRRLVFEALEGQRGDPRLLEKEEVSVLRSLQRTGRGAMVSSVRAILAYEAVAVILLRAFDCIRFAASRRTDGRVDAVGISTDEEVGGDFSAVPEDLRSALARALPLLAATGEDSRIALEWLTGDSLDSSSALFEAMLQRHFEIQRSKPPDGKRPWIEGDGGGYFVRTRYVLEEAPSKASIVHPYRTRSVRYTLKDLWRSGV
ncbi:MAG: hypothetical protein ABL998_15240 [Planctomycetota bacterium]